MCGIVGAAARRDVVGTLISGLKALEYRGYDSAGIALLTDQGLQRVRTKGKVRDLEALQAAQPIAGFTGIAHTRWATHGAPNTVNAHPIASRGNVAVVHNGIIENHDELRSELKALGYEFATETDTEVIAHLVEHYRNAGDDLLDAVRKTIARLRGAYAIAVLSRRDPGRVIGARRGSPMVVGLADGEQFIASDIHALLPVTRRFIYLAEGDVADATIEGVRIYDEHGSAGAAPGQAGAFRRRCGRTRRIPPLHAQGNPRAAAGDRRHARGAHQRRPYPDPDLRRRRARTAAEDAQRARDRVRIELPRRSRRALLDRGPRRHSVQRGNRFGIPLPRCRRAGRHPVRHACRNPAKPPIRWRR